MYLKFLRNQFFLYFKKSIEYVQNKKARREKYNLNQRFFQFESRFFIGQDRFLIFIYATE